MRSSILSSNMHHENIDSEEKQKNVINRNILEDQIDHEQNGELKRNPSEEDLPIEEVAKEEEEDVNKNHQLTFKTILPLFRKISFYCANLGLVFILFSFIQNQQTINLGLFLGIFNHFRIC